MSKHLNTPCYIIDERALRHNLEILQKVEQDTGAHVLLAQKAFACHALYPMIGRYISGTTASGLYEAMLGHEKMGLENHVYAPAYKAKDMEVLAGICDHIIFNSLAQYKQHRETVRRMERPEKPVSMGLRVNPAFSTQDHAVYDPCAPYSRLGMTAEALAEALTEDFGGSLPPDVEGLHFHTLCEQDADDLVATFRAVEKKFAPYFSQIRWINVGGGHHITRPGYQIDLLENLIREIQEKYHLDVYIEPGEAIAYQAGYLVTEVCDIVHNGMDILILDTSAACHMPDVLEMPYRPPLVGAFPAGEKAYTYRLSSVTCLAGDVIGDYSFNHPVQVGDRLAFADMAIYTMVKNNTFNGLPLPDIWLRREDGELETIKTFGYEDFANRLS